MENATRALLMVAGVFFGLLIITMILFMHGKISDFYEFKETNKKTEQLVTFNKQYSSYNRTDVRGSDLLSLTNKIIDFNNSKEAEEEEIHIEITIPNTERAKLFYYQYDTYGSKKNLILIELNKKYTHKTIKSGFLDQANKIASDYPNGLAEKLASNISTLMHQNSFKTREQLLEELNVDWVSDIKIYKYYQYQQFKRAHFDCESLEYTESGRVKRFKFEFNGKFQ